MSVKISIRVPDDLFARVRDIAASEELPLSEAFKYLLELGIRAYNSRSEGSRAPEPPAESYDVVSEIVPQVPYTPNELYRGVETFQAFHVMINRPGRDGPSGRYTYFYIFSPVSEAARGFPVFLDSYYIGAFPRESVGKLVSILKALL